MRMIYEHKTGALTPCGESASFPHAFLVTEGLKLVPDREEEATRWA